MLFKIFGEHLPFLIERKKVSRVFRNLIPKRVQVRKIVHNKKMSGLIQAKKKILWKTTAKTEILKKVKIKKPKHYETCF